MKILVSIFFVLLYSQLLAQSVAINNDGSTANSTAILDVKSNTKGMLIPRMASVERTSIASPASGLLVYDTDSIAFSYFNGAVWTFLKASEDTSKGWSTKGNTGTTTSNFIGTIDANDLYFKIHNTNAGYIKNVSNNTAIGYRSGVTVSGTNNTLIGSFSGNFPMSGSNNTGIGVQTFNNANTGSNNTAIGYYNLRGGGSGNFNTALGTNNIQYTNGNDNIAIGAYNLSAAFQTGQNFSKNIAIGYTALQKQIYGRSNIAIGEAALNNDTTSFNNVAIGYKALFNNENKNNLVAIGDSALYNNSVGSASVTQGADNTALGSKTLSGNTIGYGNTATGTNALTSNTIGGINVANGAYALKGNTTGNRNTAIGTSALYTNSTGSYNTAIGSSSLYQNSLGYSNVAIGIAALYYNTTKSNLVAIGDSALYNNGVGATAIGGTNNTAVGSKALYNNTGGFGNTAIGYNVFYNNIVGQQNTIMGTEAGFNTNNSFGTYLGYQAGINTNGVSNTYVGWGAGTDASVATIQTGGNNVCVGVRAGQAITTGSNNTFVGTLANPSVAALSNAAAFGANAFVSQSNSLILGGINGLNAATADTKVGIGVTDPTEKLEIGKGRLRFRGNLAGGNAHGITWTNNAGTIDRAFIGMENDDLIGVYNFGFGAWNLRIHNSSGEVGINKQPLLTNNDSRLQVKQTGVQNGIGIEASGSTNHWDWYVTGGANSDLSLYYNGVLKGTYGNAGGVYTPSDKRLKKDIVLLPMSITQINKLEAYKYRYLDNNATDAYSYGFMAQDVEKLFPDAVKETEIKNGEKRLGINYQYFTVLAIKGIQEQQIIIEDQNKKIENLQNQINEIKKMIKKD